MRAQAGWIVILILILTRSIDAFQDSDSSKETELQDGPLQKVKVELADIFKLRWDDEKLQIDKDHWIAVAGTSKKPDPYARMFDRGTYPKSAKYVSALFHTVGSKMGARNRGMSSSGTRMTRTMVSGNFNASLTVAESSCVIEFSELEKPGRTLSLRVYEDGRLNIMILGGKQMLVIDQIGDGSIRLMFDAGNGPKALFGKSFRELAKSDGNLLSEELGQIMDHFGVAKPMLPYDDVVKKSVRARLELLHGMDASKSFNELVSQFESKEFAVREQASKSIHEKYDLYLSLIGQKLKDPEITPEAKIRLNRIVQQNSRANQISDVVRGFDLLDSPRYLLNLGLEAIESEQIDNKTAVYVGARLKEITGQDFGADLKRWSSWVEANVVKAEKGQ